MHLDGARGCVEPRDDIVDDLGSSASTEARAAALSSLGDGLRRALEAGGSDDPVLGAVVDTAVRFRIEPSAFDRFLGAMAADLEVATYET